MGSTSQIFELTEQLRVREIGVVYTVWVKTRLIFNNVCSNHDNVRINGYDV